MKQRTDDQDKGCNKLNTDQRTAAHVLSGDNPKLPFSTRAGAKKVMSQQAG